MAAPPSATIVPRNAIRRNNSTPAVQTIKSTVVDTSQEHTKNRVSGRLSMDSFDRAKFFRSAVSGTQDDAPMSPSPPSTHGRKSRHKKSSSSPSVLASPPLVPSGPASHSFFFPGTPALSSTSEKENDIEPLDLTCESESTTSGPSSVQTPPSVARSFFGASFSVSTTPAATPPASPSLRAAPIKKGVTSDNPSPPPSPSLLARSKAYIPSIPRPSPLMPFRAAQKVVSSVTSVGTGLLPSKEQLGSIPVAGRILKHPVMDSTLTYIASKTTRRGSKGQGDADKIIPPEDVHYRKLNRKLVDQSITLAALAIEKEEQSKFVDDEAGDDAFELYLAAIATLMHALPIETCDPLRKEAFETQLRSFLDDNQLAFAEEEIGVSDKELRRERRRRHRHFRDQASSLIDHYSPTSQPVKGPAPASAKQSAAATSNGSTQQSKHNRRRHGEVRGRSGSSSGLGDTIINTAVESAIRLKQSPIPDVIRTCFRASRAVLAKVDERFHLQEKAWQISKQSIEKAIELDEQYAIHEVVTETFFATVTGLLKAGIAYKETPSYAATRASLTQPTQAALPPVPSKRMVQQSKRYSGSSSGSAMSVPSILRGRRYSIIEEEEEESEEAQTLVRNFGAHNEQTRYGGDSDGYDSEDSSKSSSCFSSETSPIHSSSSSVMGDVDGAPVADSNFENDLGLYADQMRQKVDLFMALKGAASLFLSSGQLANQ
ncbi:hypothetical protein BG004_002747 [Podila humilis]|nr:hypothetical protein BG004_002747 [Podila humilis]